MLLPAPLTLQEISGRTSVRGMSWMSISTSGHERLSDVLHNRQAPAPHHRVSRPMPTEQAFLRTVEPYGVLHEATPWHVVRRLQHYIAPWAGKSTENRGPESICGVMRRDCGRAPVRAGRHSGGHEPTLTGRGPTRGTHFCRAQYAGPPRIMTPIPERTLGNAFHENARCR